MISFLNNQILLKLAKIHYFKDFIRNQNFLFFIKIKLVYLSLVSFFKN